MSQHDPNTHHKAVVLLSGGLDSAVALGLIQQTHQVVLAVTVNYGQRNWPQEWQAAQTLAHWAGVKHLAVDLPWLAALLPTGMQTHVNNHSRDTLEAVWVPNRNGILLNMAAAFAEHYAAQTVVFGANADEGAAFPDNTPDYRQAVNAALRFSTRNHVKVLAPVETLTKAQIWQTGLQLGIPLHATWSCYDNGAEPCGVCLSCQHRHNAERGQPLTL
jgi:7-cyano-7-deazaguanine synthase